MTALAVPTDDEQRTAPTHLLMIEVRMPPPGRLRAVKVDPGLNAKTCPR